jgi:hypothetical protein
MLLDLIALVLGCLAGFLFGRKQTVGTRSLLFGVHQVFLHPWFVAAAWWKLNGFPCDLRLWVAFFVHDLGYRGKKDMDGAEGETHVELGAKIMAWLFDHDLNHDWWVFDLFDPSRDRKLPSGYQFFGLPVDRSVHTWHDFSLYHSRFYATSAGEHYSRLCVADKLAITLYPRWMYLLLANASGEIQEYMNPNVEKYRSFLAGVRSQREWFDKLVVYLNDWVENAIKEEQEHGTTKTKLG